MTREEATKIFRKEIECLSHTKCSDCILEKVCDPINTTPLDSEYIEAFSMAIEALSTSEIPNKCEDAISRQAVLVGIEELKKSPWATDKRGNGFEYLIKEALDVVADLCVKKEPSVTPKQKMCFDGMTNGEVIGLLFPNAVIYHNRDFTLREMIFPDEWWNEPYKAESEVSE